LAKPGMLEFVRPVTEANRGSCRRLTGLRRVTTTGRCGVRSRACTQADFLAVRWVASMRDDFKVVFDL